MALDLITLRDPDSRTPAWEELGLLAVRPSASDEPALRELLALARNVPSHFERWVVPAAREAGSRALQHRAERDLALQGAERQAPL